MTPPPGALGGLSMHTTLLDSPMIQQLWGGPIWQAFLTIGRHSIAGRSRYRWLAMVKAVVNHVTYIACGRGNSNRLWWRLRWD